MDRRNFIKLGIAGAATGIIAPEAILAKSVSKIEVAGAGGVYYTKQSPGRWSKKVDGHLPKVTLTKSAGASTVEILTPHSMKSFDHYIVKHILLDKDFKFLSEKLFNPSKIDIAKSSHILKNYSGTLYALSVCNKHDTWLEIAQIT